jgi:hypothetical protein
MCGWDYGLYGKVPLGMVWESGQIGMVWDGKVSHLHNVMLELAKNRF